MIDLTTTTGEAIDLSPAALTIEQHNVLLTSSSLFRSGFSYPVELAATSKNRRIFSFFELLETTPSYGRVPVFVRLGGAEYTSAILQLGVSGGRFSGHLKLEEAAISEKLNSRKLTDLAFETFEIGTPTAMATKMMETVRSNNGSFTFFPLKNTDFLPSEDPTKAPVINHWDGSAFPLHHQDQRSPIVPFFYLIYVLKAVAKDLGLSLRGDFSMHPDIQQLVILNPVAVIGNQNIALNAKNHLPPLLLKDFLRELTVFFNLSAQVIDGYLDLSWKKTVLEQPRYTDWTSKMLQILSQDFENISDGYHLSAECDSFVANGAQKLAFSGSVEQKTSLPVPPPKDEVIVGHGKLKISTKAASLPLVSHHNYADQIPEDKREGVLLRMEGTPIDENFKSLYAKPGEPSNFPLRFLFCTNADGKPSSSRRGSFFDLQISGDNGLHAFAYKNWMDKTHAARRIKIRVLLHPVDLLSLKESKTVLIKSASGAVVECLWRKITFSGTEAKAIIPTEVELIVLNPSKI